MAERLCFIITFSFSQPCVAKKVTPMKIKPSRHTVVTTLLVLLIAVTGLTSYSDVNSGCSCVAGHQDASRLEKTSCCSTMAIQEPECCRKKVVQEARGCCCNPSAKECECGTCDCSESDESKLPFPALPTNESTELVSTTLSYATPVDGYQCGSDPSKLAYSQSVSELTTLSSQQTCVLLSRFTC